MQIATGNCKQGYPNVLILTTQKSKRINSIDKYIKAQSFKPNIVEVSKKLKEK